MRKLAVILMVFTLLGCTNKTNEQEAVNIRIFNSPTKKDRNLIFYWGETIENAEKRNPILEVSDNYKLEFGELYENKGYNVWTYVSCDFDTVEGLCSIYYHSSFATLEGSSVYRTAHEKHLKKLYNYYYKVLKTSLGSKYMEELALEEAPFYQEEFTGESALKEVYWWDIASSSIIASISLYKYMLSVNWWSPAFRDKPQRR